jgi:predicted HicB family RNase H-like nuclease
METTAHWGNLYVMNNQTFLYKGYTGSIEVSVEDSCLHGEILFIDDIITYEGTGVDELQVSFNAN